MANQKIILSELNNITEVIKLNGKKPTRSQRKFIEAHKLNSANWLVQKDTTEIMQLVHRKTGTIRALKK